MHEYNKATGKSCTDIVILKIYKENCGEKTCSLEEKCYLTGEKKKQQNQALHRCNSFSNYMNVQKDI